MKEESKGVVPKLLSVCEDDIQILLSMDTSADEKQHIRNNMRSLNEPSKHANEPAMRISTAASRGCSNVLAPCKLRSILGQVANGLISSWSLFLTILELSEGENVEVSESALRVLLCLITRDEGCQNRLFRRNTSALQPRVLKAVASGHFSKNNALLPASVPFEGLSCDLSVNAVLNKYFPSSRISWYNEASPQCQDNAQEVSGQDNLKLQINKESCEEASRNHISSDKSTQFALMRRIFEGALNKAVKGYNRTISITAVSILIVIVANSEPMSSREDFGFALFDGSIASLLKVSVALEVRSQAVRLVHSLLHCPAVLSRLLKVKDVYDEQESEVSRPVEEVMQGTDINARIAEEEVAVQHGDEITGLCQTERNVNCSGENSRYDVLEGLISSLANAGFTTQAYTLKRHVLRVLTYITISDHRGAAFLLEKQFVVNPTGISLKNPDKSKEEKFPAIMQTGSLPMHLIGFIDEELKIEGLRENSVAFEPNEERECVLCEMLTLLCRFASHSTESLRTIRLLSTDKNIARISISVINRVMNRSFLSVRPKFQGQQVTSSVDIIELCRGLRRRILSNLSDM
ncbi:hypothetical protein KP509_32G050000 [Ceratopteris richardii]|uniref:Ig-like domain-containing protein n=1 Tax=Ceratopteris richardii TaxID=49495 RepID=A0A8T2QV61_CERRI|nr:hypothetical protein KP509_32G050000 [Ceratopteris richardii]